jgi:hypothetical protein
MKMPRIISIADAFSSNGRLTDNREPRSITWFKTRENAGMTLRRLTLAALAGCAFGAASMPAQAQETTTYTYDAQGRLKSVTRSGGQNNGVATTYVYDKAGNRTNVTTTGSQNGSGGTGGGATSGTQGFVVTPLGGYALIFYSG